MRRVIASLCNYLQYDIIALPLRNCSAIVVVLHRSTKKSKELHEYHCITYKAAIQWFGTLIMVVLFKENFNFSNLPV